jgi:2-keto-myo-inositol isomerase
LNRRHFFRSSLLTVGLGVVSPLSFCTNSQKKSFRYCLNTSTIRNDKFGIKDYIKITALAGYDGIEIWVHDLKKYADNGGSLSALRDLLENRGLKVEGAIGFSQWLANDESIRKKAIEQLLSEMKLLAKVGCQRIAAPPAGATKGQKINLDVVANRYRAIVELGEKTGVIPQLELWGFSKNLSSLNDIAYVLIKANHPKAAMLLDAFHLYKGNNNFENLKYINNSAMDMFHMNDYPASPQWDKITDAQRIYPGDGIAPLSDVIRDLYAPGQPKVLSLELFNPDLWKKDPLDVAKVGLNKLKSVVNEALKK